MVKATCAIGGLVLSLSLAANARVTTTESGAARYEKLCAGCHGGDGLALEGEAPPLAGSSWVSGSETTLIRIVMHGVRGPIQVADQTYDREMPGFGVKLTDEEMASLLTFVRRRWGGTSAPTTPETVGRVRAAARTRTRFWTVKELLQEIKN